MGASLRSSPLLVILTWEERTLTTEWWITLSTSSRGSTRRTSRVTRGHLDVSVLPVSEQRGPCQLLPRLTLRLTLSLKVLTSTPLSPGLVLRSFAQIFSRVLWSLLRRL